MLPGYKGRPRRNQGRVIYVPSDQFKITNDQHHHISPIGLWNKQNQIKQKYKNLTNECDASLIDMAFIHLVLNKFYIP